MQLRRYFKNSKFILFSDQFVHSGTSFLTTIFIIRNFSAQALGEYNLYLIPFLFIQSILDSLFLTPAQTQLPRINKRNLVIKRIKTLLGVFILSSIIGAIIFYFIFLNPESIFSISKSQYNKNSLLLTLLFIFSNCIYMYFRKSLYILFSYKHLFLGSLLRSLLILSSFIIIFLFNLEFKNIIYIISVFNLIISIYFLKEIKIKFHLLKITYLSNYFKRSIILTKKLFFTAKWLFPTAILQASYGELIYIFALTILSINQLGEIKALFAIVSIQNLLFQVLDQYSLIKVSKIIKEEGLLKGSNYILSLQKTLILGSIILLLIIIFISPYLLNLIYGTELLHLENHLRLIFIYPILNSLIYPRKVFLIASDKSKYSLIGYIITCIFSFAFLKPFLNTFGNFGLLLIFLFGQIISLICIYPNIFFKNIFLLRKNLN